MLSTVFRRNNTDLFDVFDDLVSRSVTTATQHAYFPRVDIHEDNEAVYLDADLPGLEKKDIRINFENDVLKLSGERDDTRNRDGYYRYERQVGKFERSFHVGDQVDPSKTTAKFKDGVLYVVIPKKEVKEPASIPIDIS